MSGRRKADGPARQRTCARCGIKKYLLWGRQDAIGPWWCHPCTEHRRLIQAVERCVQMCGEWHEIEEDERYYFLYGCLAAMGQPGEQWRALAYEVYSLVMQDLVQDR